MKTKWLVYIIVTLFFIITPAVGTVVINDSNIVFNNTGHNISFSTNQTFDNMSFPSDNLVMEYNSTELHINSSQDLILSNLAYNNSSDVSNFTANGTGTGTLNIAERFQKNNTFYYLYINHTSPPVSYSISNTTNWTTYSYTLSSIHDITITSVTPVLTSLLLTAVTAGTSGNSITTTETSAVASWSAPTLLGGLDMSDFLGMQNNFINAGETGASLLIVLIIAFIGSMAIGYIYVFKK